MWPVMKVLTDKGMTRNSDKVKDGNVINMKSLGFCRNISSCGGLCFFFYWLWPHHACFIHALAMMSLLSRQLGMPQVALSIKVSE